MSVMTYFFSGGVALALMPRRWMLWVLAFCVAATVMGGFSMDADMLGYVLYLGFFLVGISIVGFAVGLIFEFTYRALSP